MKRSETDRATPAARSSRVDALRAVLALGASTAPLLALALTAISCGESEPPPPKVMRPVRYEPVFATGGTRVRTFAGVAQAGVESDLSFKVAGTIERIPVKIGDEVRAGALIAKLDDQDYRLAMQQAQASLTRASAEARNAKASYDRVRALYEEGNASRTELDNARTASEAAAAQVSASEKQLELAQLQLGYCTLTAPVAGSIADVRADVNENVAAGQTISRLTSGGRSEVEVGVPEVLIGDVREGSTVEVVFDAIAGERFAATVTEVGISSTGTSSTYRVTVLLDAEDSRIRPGMAAEVAFSFGTGDTRERFIVPSVAVGEDRLGRYVYVLEHGADEVGTVHRKAVEVGDLTSEGIEISSGLADGDLIVTAGVNRLADGDSVRVPEPGTAGR